MKQGAKFVLKCLDGWSDAAASHHEDQAWMRVSWPTLRALMLTLHVSAYRSHLSRLPPTLCEFQVCILMAMHLKLNMIRHEDRCPFHKSQACTNKPRCFGNLRSAVAWRGFSSRDREFRVNSTGLRGSLVGIA